MLTKQQLQAKINELNSLVNRFPQDYRVYYNRATFLIENIDNLLASSLEHRAIIKFDLDKVIELITPYFESSEAHLLHYTVSYLFRHLFQDTYQAAIKDIDKAIELQASDDLFILFYRLQFAKDPKIANNSINYLKKVNGASILHENRDFPKALSIYNDLIHTDSNNPATYISRGRLYAEINEGEKADQDYNTAIKLIKEYKITSVSEIRYLKELQSITFLEKGINRSDYHSALHEIKKAIKINPDNYHAHIMLAKVYMEQGTHDNLIAAEQQLLSIKDRIPRTLKYKKTLAELYEQLGNIYLLKGDYPKMRWAYEHALALDEKNIETILTLAYYYTFRNDRHEAQYWLGRIQTVNPQQASAEKIMHLFNAALNKGIDSVIKGFHFPSPNPKKLPSKSKLCENAQSNFSSPFFYLFTAGAAVLIIAFFYFVIKYCSGKQKKISQERPASVPACKKQKPVKQKPVALPEEKIAASANQLSPAAEFAVAAEKETAADKALKERILQEKEKTKQEKRRAEQKRLQEKKEKERRLNEVARRAEEQKRRQKESKLQVKSAPASQSESLKSTVQSEAGITTTPAPAQKSSGSLTLVINNPKTLQFFNSEQAPAADNQKPADTVTQKYLTLQPELEPWQKGLFKSVVKKIATQKFPCLRNAEDYLSNINPMQPIVPGCITLTAEQALLFHKCYILGSIIRTFIQILEEKDEALTARLGGHTHLADIRNRLVHYSYLILAKDIKAFKDTGRKLVHVLEGNKAGFAVTNLTQLLPLLTELPQMADLTGTLTPQTVIPTAKQILVLLDKLKTVIRSGKEHPENYQAYFTSATAIMIFSTLFKDLQLAIPDFAKTCQAYSSLAELLQAGRELRNVFAHDTDDLPPVGDYTITSPLKETEVAQFAERASKGIANLSSILETMNENKEIITKVTISSR